MPNTNANGVILNVDLTNGAVNGSTTGKLTLFLNIIATAATGGNKIFIYSCENAADASSQDCSDAAHYSKEVGSITIPATNNNAISFTLKIINSANAGYASVKLDAGSVSFIRIFYYLFGYFYFQ